MIRYSVLLVVLGLCACASVPDQGSCDGRPKVQVCTDILENETNQTRSALDGLCVGTYSDDLCDRTGALGGCECTGCDNGRLIEWRYPDPVNNINTAADVMAACGTKTFVTP
jgi:hypothetical protein